MTTEHGNAPGTGLCADVLARMAGRLGEIPKSQQVYAREVVACQLDILETVLGAGPDAAWTGRHRATVRMLGHEWAARCWPLDPLLALPGRIAEEAAEVLLRQGIEIGTTEADTLKVVSDVGHRFLAELFRGFQEVHKPREHQTDTQAAALALLRGQSMPAHLHTEPAPAYGVLAFRIAPEDIAGQVPDNVAAWLADQSGHGSLYLACDQGGYLLAPAEDLAGATAAARQLQSRLPPASWTGISWRPLAELPAARTEAVEIVTSALAAQRAPGCYQLSDVLVEYAVLQQPSVSELLVKLIEPVVHNPVLLETLNALLASNGNRSKAAADLIIHRSTLDYRLNQIERLTGHAPSSSRALQLLGAALTAHTATRCTLSTFPAWDV